MGDFFGPSDHLVELQVAGFRREYLLHIPSCDLMPRPVVMLLHGTGGTVKWTQNESRMAAFAEQMDFIAVYPQALPPDPNSPPRFIHNPPAWEDGGPRRPGKPFVDDLAYFHALLDDLPSRVAIDPTRVFATGFSNGASMCFRLAAELSDRIAATAPVAGYCRVAEVKRPVPTLFIIGDADPMVPPRGGAVISPWTKHTMDRPPIDDSLNRWAKLIGCDTPPTVESDVDGIRRERYAGPVEFSRITVAGLGHHWPGGRGQLKRKLAGPWNNRLDANEAVWEFFRRCPPLGFAR